MYVLYVCNVLYQRVYPSPVRTLKRTVLYILYIHTEGAACCTHTGTGTGTGLDWTGLNCRLKEVFFLNLYSKYNFMELIVGNLLVSDLISTYFGDLLILLYEIIKWNGCAVYCGDCHVFFFFGFFWVFGVGYPYGRNTGEWEYTVAHTIAHT